MTSIQQADPQAQQMSTEKQAAGKRDDADIDSQAAAKSNLDACLYVVAGFFLYINTS